MNNNIIEKYIKVTIKNKERLIDVINIAINYGGDKGGAYFNEESKLELIKKIKEYYKYDIVFNSYGYVVDLKRR